MGCGCGGGNNTTIPNQGPPVQIAQKCLYTLIQLQSLFSVCNPQEKSIIDSQINIYTVGCNTFSSIIIPLLTKYNL